jgi:serine/threonine protein phosphatase PrpC
VCGEVAGRNHRKEDISCQDKTYYAEENGVIAIALADGAGSAFFSQLGAESVVHTAVHYVLKSFDKVCKMDKSRSVMEEFLSVLRMDLNNVAVAQGCDIHQLASTLLLVAVKGDQTFALHIGDGIIGRIKEGTIQVVSKPMNGEFANETYFVTDENALVGMEILRGKNTGTEAFLLMSDGTGENFYDKSTEKLVPILKKIVYDIRDVDNPNDGERMLASVLNYIVDQNTYDDCSLAIMFQ